mmetsp:Transcript_8880/g.19350  ORF Transcript_8880/g.19350 Transcript_8880/m.19350 type:complete len:569 (+) Transcript_8880:33-1739(+)
MTSDDIDEVLAAHRLQSEKDVQGTLDSHEHGEGTFCSNPYSLPGSPQYVTFIQELRSSQTRRLILAYHGTHEANVESICRDGLDKHRRGTANGQAFGPGEYVSPSLGKALSYSRGGMKVLVFAVLADYITEPGTHIIVVSDSKYTLPVGVITFSSLSRGISTWRGQFSGGFLRLLKNSLRLARSGCVTEAAQMYQQASLDPQRDHQTARVEKKLLDALAASNATVNAVTQGFPHLLEHVVGREAICRKFYSAGDSLLKIALADAKKRDEDTHTFAASAMLRAISTAAAAEVRYVESKIMDGTESRVKRYPESALIMRKLDRHDFNEASEAYLAFSAKHQGQLPLPFAAEIGFRLAQLQVDVSLFRDFFPGALEAATSSHCDADPTGRAPSDSSSTNTMDTHKARLAPDNTNADVALPQQADSSALPGTGVRMQEAYTTRNCTSALKRKRSEAETPVDCLCTSILRLIQLGDINAACTFYLQAIPPGDQVPPMALATQVGFQLGQMRLDLSMLHGFFPGAIKAAAAFRQSMHRQSREASPSHSVAASCKAETQRADGVALASAVASVLA